MFLFSTKLQQKTQRNAIVNNLPILYLILFWNMYYFCGVKFNLHNKKNSIIFAPSLSEYLLAEDENLQKVA